MGGTYTAKIKMVKYLHEECGFDVLAFESPMYNLSKINELLEMGMITPKEMGWNISGIWNTQEVKELFEYLIETRKTKHPLIFAGFDESFFNSSCKGNLKEDYSVFIDSLEKISNVKIKLDSLFYNKIKLVAEKSYSFSKLPVEDTLLLNNKFDEIRNVLKKVNYEIYIYLNFWKHMTDNLQSVYRKKYNTGNRDLQMAKNVIFLAENLYPDKKIILWAATTHLLFNTLDIEEFKKNETYQKNKMGVYLRNRYKEKYYLLAFTALQGKVGFKGYMGLGKHKISTTNGSIERYVDKLYQANYAYIPLRSNEVRLELEKNKIIKSSLWGIKESKMIIPNVADGIFYIKNEHLVNF
jgi:erythromycin esterase-like protein